MLTPRVFPVPKDLQRLVAEIDGWLELRCNDKAFERLQPLLEHPEARPAGLALRVRCSIATKKHKDAMTDIAELRGTTYDPEWLDLTEAWCRKRMQDLPGAVRCMEQLLARNPKSAIGHFNLGCYLALSGERERALDEITLACGIDQEYRSMLADEPDLDSLRRDGRFRSLCSAPAPDPDQEAEDAAADDAFEDDVLGGFEGGDDEGDDSDDPHGPDEDAEPRGRR
jgi:hypothetical protein